MMKVKFLESVKGSINGITSKQFEKDSIYSVNGVEISEYLCKAWLSKGILEEYKEKAVEIIPEVIEEVEIKAISNAPENKAIFNTPENKAIVIEETVKKPLKNKSKK